MFLVCDFAIISSALTNTSSTKLGQYDHSYVASVPIGQPSWACGGVILWKGIMVSNLYMTFNTLVSVSCYYSSSYMISFTCGHTWSQKILEYQLIRRLSWWHVALSRTCRHTCFYRFSQNKLLLHRFLVYTQLPVY